MYISLFIVIGYFKSTCGKHTYGRKGKDGCWDLVINSIREELEQQSVLQMRKDILQQQAHCIPKTRSLSDNSNSIQLSLVIRTSKPNKF